ncbi:alpha-(1,3)-fucosyltransferase C-like [Littorina saxatilis]|uniref:alpha-(1,3)-fucosyltransferase C-like n=1 Tax=Littorina saxatilis TaxID=31220 RepID=UPI0038B4D3E4
MFIPKLSPVVYSYDNDGARGTFGHHDERTPENKDLSKAVLNNNERNDHVGKDNRSSGDSEGTNDDTATSARLLKDATAVSDDPDKLSSPYILTKEEQAFCSGEEFKPPPKQFYKDKGKAKVILYYQEGNHFPEKKGGFSEQCLRPTRGPCTMTFDRSQQTKAHAVVFHASKMHRSAPPFRKPPGQIWVARGMEAPNHWYLGYKSPRWRGVFNWTMTYRTHSDFFAPIGQLVRLDSPPKKDFRRIVARKTRSVAWFVSSCDTQYKYGSRREDYAKELGKHIDVDIYGECGSLSCPKKHGSLCDDLLTHKYRFYLSFENSLCREYVTEKFFDKFGEDVDIVPVVLGGVDYQKYFPEGTYINTADFPSPRGLARYLHALGENLEAYTAMLERKARYTHSRCRSTEPWCRLCDMLHEPNLTSKVYEDLPAWLETDACVESSKLSYYKKV